MSNKLTNVKKVHSKRMKAIANRPILQHTDLNSILQDIKNNCTAKFVESIDLTVRLGINPKKSDENIRTTFQLAHGLPFKKKILVFVDTQDIEACKAAGADIVGSEELIDKIKQEGSISADICITTPDMFKKITSITKILGPQGLMPNAKDGTISSDIIALIQDLKSGKKVKARNDNAGYMSLSVGKANFTNDQISENIKSVVSHLQNNKPSKVKVMIKGLHISSTMGAGAPLPLRFI